VNVGEVTVDFPAAMSRVRSIIDGLRDSLDGWLAGVAGLDQFHGTATVISDPAGQEHRVAVNDQQLTAEQLYLNLGARASRPPIPGLETVEAMTEVELLALDSLPEHLVIIGGGYIGLEFGQMFRRFGARVTIITGSRVAPREDEDVSGLLAEMLTDEGVDLVIGRPARVGQGKGGIDVEFADGRTVSGSHLLLATGRRSNSDLLGPDHGIETDKRGFFTIDDRFQTSVKGVWALGDVNGHGAFTHTAYQDGQILLHPPRTVDGRVPIYALYTDPPLGRVGMTISEARASGRNVLQAEVPMSSVSRAILEGETTGLMRILVDGDTEEFLGATILGLHGDDLIQIIGTAMQAGVRYPAVRDALPIHPTMAEFIPSVLTSLKPLD
jgi:pyruvate/2-oxoglutarate dehydrogenase complex dihydrolipoamide dehydrogenase (E3) component